MTDQTPEAREQAIQARLEAATHGAPAPWSIVTPDLLRNVPELDPAALIIANLDAEQQSASVVADVWDCDDAEQQYANADLIANAPADLAYLLERCAALQVERDKLAKQLEQERRMSDIIERDIERQAGLRE